MAAKFIVFDIWSTYGHFKKPYTTSSPLTFSIPPRTSITGIIAAIAGVKKDEYIKLFSKDKADIALSVRKPIKKVRMGINLINFNNSMTKIEGKNPTRVEFLKDPEYRIYFRHRDDEIHSRVLAHINNHTSIYTVSMGLSENVANFKFIGEFAAEKKHGDEELIEFTSVLPLKCIHPGQIKFNYDQEYFTETLPIEMDEDRKVLEYGEVIYEKSGKSICAIVNSYLEFKEVSERIVVL